MIDINKIPYDDEKVWKLIQSGNTKGVFQCESKLVQHWLKKVSPNNVWELSAVISLVRPGPLLSGYCEEYVQARDSNERKTFNNPIVDGIFESTNGILIYQEQIISLGNLLAWKHLSDKERLVKSDNLRKAIGKKDQAKVVSIGKEFVEGCIQNGLVKETADELFEVIKKSGRYVFNLSHAFAYAKIAYQTAYLKQHNYLSFLSTYLTYAKFKKKDKWKEIQDLINEAKIFGVNVVGPDINSKNEHFKIEQMNGDFVIRYGLAHMKYFGGKTIDLINTLPEIRTWQQVVKLCCSEHFGKQLGINTVKALISTGAFKCGLSRISLLNLIECLNRCSPKELEYVINNVDTLDNVNEIKNLLNKCAESTSIGKRKETLRSESAVLNLNEYDHPGWVEKSEIYYMGASINISAIDGKQVNSVDKCVECVGDVPLYSMRTLPVIIDQIKITETKKGKNPGQKMAIISVHDSSGKLDRLPIFPEQFLSFEELLIQDNTVELSMKMGKGGWCIENVKQI